MPQLQPDFFAKELLRWHADFGRHNLPWQNNPSPYRVWVSEIMLQQTQVKTVLSFYETFMNRFPGISELSSGSLDEVLNLWAGLGYYARARNLHLTSKIIMKEHNGMFPDEVGELIQLPGIGRSTAGAILALSFERKASILDGNAKRIFCRYHAIKAWPNSADTMRKLWNTADRHLPDARIRDYTQALMDLGATVCKLKNPACGKCPLNSSCAACLSTNIATFPGRKATRKKATRSTILLIVENKNGEVLLEKRPNNGIWGGLWSLPEEDNEISAKKRIADFHPANKFGTLRLPKFVHQFTHFKLIIKPIRFTASSNPRIGENNVRIWRKPEDTKDLGMPKPVRNLMTRYPDYAINVKGKRSG